MPLRELFFLFFIATSASAQEKNFDITGPLDIAQAGWNKVLCMKNGNTLLFHFEPGKRISVTVFNSARKQVATSRDATHELNEQQIEFAVFKGLYDINGEAVLFIDQDRYGRHQLVMARYNGSNGTLIEDRIVGESQSENRRIRYYVMKDKDDDNYSILFCMDKRHPKQTDMFIVFFDKYHKSVCEIQLPVDRKKFDYLAVLGAESQPQGTLITVGLDETELYGKIDHAGALQNGGSVYEHNIAYYYIPKGDTVPQTGLIKLSPTIFPFYALYTYNPFAGALNSLVFSYKPLYYQFGLNITSGFYSGNFFFKIINDDRLSATYSFIRNEIATDTLRQHTDSSRSFVGIPVKMFTNGNGLSTLVFQAETPFGEPETRVRYGYQDYFGNIGITQFGDDGNEIWGTVLPMAQYFKSNKQYYPVKRMAGKAQEQVIFGDLPEQVYGRQFVSFNAYANDRNYYIIFNDYNKNFGNTLEKPGDTVYSFSNTNAVYYKIDRKKQVSKHYLFGTPVKDEYTCSFVEGAGYDEQQGTYATLIQYNRHGEISLRMAWCKLE